MPGVSAASNAFQDPAVSAVKIVMQQVWAQNGTCYNHIMITETDSVRRLSLAGHQIMTGLSVRPIPIRSHSAAQALAVKSIAPTVPIFV
jgi:hypothetical protein